MKSIFLFAFAAVLEIAGCFAFWQWQRADKSAIWLAPGLVALAGFAWILTRVDLAFAGRAYAAYGGIYIAMALFWLWAAEGRRPDHWDLTGATISVVGALVILFAPRGT